MSMSTLTRWARERQRRRAVARYATRCTTRAAQLRPGMRVEVWVNDCTYGSEDGVYPATVTAVGPDIPAPVGELDVRQYDGCPPAEGLVELEISDPAGYGRGFTCGPYMFRSWASVFLGLQRDPSRVVVPAALVAEPGTIRQTWADTGLRIGGAA
jgi:hypothetical protein